MNSYSLINLSPLAWLLLMGGLIALLPVGWVLFRQTPEGLGGALDPVTRVLLRRRRTLRALTVLTLFLTFDLIVFGAYTRLSDSGLGCPDWPGCYGNASPLGAHAEIHAAQSAMPSGPVTVSKAWIEMVHRYLATGVGALILGSLVAHLVLWRRLRRLTADRAAAPGLHGIRPGLAALVLLWVCAQGAFGALTVTLKLYPAIVTLHLLGGIGLLALLALQVAAFDVDPADPAGLGWRLSPRLRAGLGAFLALMIVQVALGGWVSTNYAVLACQDFPRCQGQWWPMLDFEQAFTVRRELGRTGQGEFLSFAALTAIHLTHRLVAAVVAALAVVLVIALARVPRRTGAGKPGAAVAHSAAWALAAWLLWQVGSGISNAVLGWPLLAALAHTAGAAACVAALVWLLARTRPGHASLSSRSRIRHDAAAPGAPAV